MSVAVSVTRSSPKNTDDRIWEAEIWYEGVHYTLGAFESEETAARAYACAAFSLYDSAAIEVGIQQERPPLFSESFTCRKRENSRYWDYRS